MLSVSGTTNFLFLGKYLTSTNTCHLWGVWTNSELQLFYHTFICVEYLLLGSMIHDPCLCMCVSALKTVFMDIKHILNVCCFIIVLLYDYRIPNKNVKFVVCLSFRNESHIANGLGYDLIRPQSFWNGFLVWLLPKLDKRIYTNEMFQLVKWTWVKIHIKCQAQH